MVGSSQSKDSKEQALVPAENLMCDHDASSIKRRKLVQKTVVAVKIEANDGKHKCEGPPSDFWSWRKYGQKPIKGSPYPRGYYRCSTSKGCSAKKQVERCRTDASVLIITYTSDHNHPGPHLQNLPISEENTNPLKELSQEIVSEIEDPSSSSATTPEPTLNTEISPLQSNPIPLVDQEIKEEHQLQLQQHHHHHHIELNIVALSSSTTTSTTPPKTSELEDNDFFDELEELPMMSSSFTSFMRGSFFDDRILLLP